MRVVVINKHTTTTTVGDEECTDIIDFSDTHLVVESPSLLNNSHFVLPCYVPISVETADGQIEGCVLACGVCVCVCVCVYVCMMCVCMYVYCVCV